MTKPLSPAALAVWEAFNQDEAGVFVDYGDKLAAALRAVADHLKLETPLGDTDADAGVFAAHHAIYIQLLAIADELEGNHPGSPDGSDGPVVPEGREPASVTTQHSDAELDELFTEIDQSGECLSWRAYARAVLARWGGPR